MPGERFGLTGLEGTGPYSMRETGTTTQGNNQGRVWMALSNWTLKRWEARQASGLRFLWVCVVGFSGERVLGLDNLQASHKLHHDIDRVSVAIYADASQAAVFRDFELRAEDSLLPPRLGGEVWVAAAFPRGS